MAFPTLVLRGGRVIDPSRKLDEISDLVIVDGKIASIGATKATAEVIDCSGKIVAPGFVDLHVHLREPGHEYKEDIASGARAAAAGGFTTICCMPNTEPPNDNRAVTELIVRRAREAACVNVRPVGAISKGLKGESLAEMGEMKDAGIVAVSDDGKPVMNGALMRRALEYARTFGLPVVQHAEDLDLAQGGLMNEGAVSTRIGLRGQPSAAESTMVARDLELVALTGARYHVAHISTAASVRLLREAKARKLPVTCEVTPHHLTLTDAACAHYDTHAKCAPPLRTTDDIAALKAGLADGTIDCIATDHAPHSSQDKAVEFAEASFGMIGLETAFALCLRLLDEGVLSLSALLGKLTYAPARVFELGAGTLAIGAPADVVVLDLTQERTFSRSHSKSRNSPFWGQTLRGAVAYTVVGGNIVHRESE